MAAFGAGLSVREDEVRLFVALRRGGASPAVRHVPWLRTRLFGAVEDYAQGHQGGRRCAARRDAAVEPSKPEALDEALSGAALFHAEDTEEQKAALARLGTLLALVEGWVATVTADAASDELPQADAWPRPSGGGKPRAAPPSVRS